MNHNYLLKALLFSFLLFSSGQFAHAQTRNVSGKVTAPDGMPIPGVNVIVKSTTTGAVTDL